MKEKLPLVFHENYHVEGWQESHRFPMAKFIKLKKLLEKDKILSPENLFKPEMPSLEDLLLVHSKEYCQNFLNGSLERMAQRRIGLPWSEELKIRTQIAVGGTRLTALLALDYGLCCNLAGGTHHAHSDFGSGFCIFNDVSLAARHLISKKLVKKVLIIDLDVHQGDGTAAIHSGEKEIFTFSMHCQKNFPFRKSKSDLDIGLDENLSDKNYMFILKSTLPELLENEKPDFIFYNAGVDVYEADPLGKLSISLEGIKARDLFVIESALEKSIPCACVIGGGYSKDLNELSYRHSILHRSAKELFEKYLV